MNEIDIVKAYNDGKDIRAIANDIGKSFETIRQILKRNNIEWHRKYICDLKQEQVRDILNKFDEKITITQISKEYGISEPAISRLLRANDREPIGSNRKYDILRQVPIKQYQKDLIIGTVLGDGCLYKDSPNGMFKLSFGHCEKQKEYFLWKIQQLDPFINTWRKNIDNRGNSVMYQTSTICHQELNQIANMFYDSSRIKHIPENISELMTPLGLAVWIMDDGYLKNKRYISLATMCFTMQEHETIKKMFKDKFDIDARIKPYKYKTKDYIETNFSFEDSVKISNICKEHIVECMKYKFIL